jgi:hypothetical protein
VRCSARSCIHLRFPLLNGKASEKEAGTCEALVNQRMVKWMRRNRRSKEVTGSFGGFAARVPLGGEVWHQWHHLSFRILPFLIEKLEHVEHPAAIKNSGLLNMTKGLPSRRKAQSPSSLSPEQR